MINTQNITTKNQQGYRYIQSDVRIEEKSQKNCAIQNKLWMKLQKKRFKQSSPNNTPYKNEVNEKLFT